MIFVTATADAAVHYVTQEGGAGTKDGKSWTTAYDEASFPAAILSAKAGDEIWVKAGVYRPVIPANPASVTEVEQGKSFVLSNDVALYGGFAGTETSSADRDSTENLTVLTGDLTNNDTGKVNGVTVSADQIQGTNSTCVVTAGSGCGPTTVLDGFTVTAGDNANNGGGMYIMGSAPTVRDCTFSGNTADSGGGMYNETSSPAVTNCTFSGNKAFAGGSMANCGGSAPIVTNCAFFGNTANRGGGVFNLNSSPSIIGCIFSDNIVSVYGGGMENSHSNPTVTNCTFSGNSAEDGGGMDNLSSNPNMTNCTFSGNTASEGGGMNNISSSPAVKNCTFSGNTADYGGGMLNGDGGDSGSSPTVTNCTFFGNAADYGGGMCNAGVSHSGSAPAVTNCTFFGNSAGAGGGGMCNYMNYAAPVVRNSVFWDDAGGEITKNFGSDPVVSYCIVSGDYSIGTNIITADPNLGPLADNGGPTQTCALLSGSSAIDKGMTFASNVISTDQRGVARPQGVSFDIGAYEYWEKQILTVTTIGSGSATPSPIGVVVGTTGKCWGYVNGTPVTLTASEDARSVFDSWGGDASGTNLATTVTMNNTKNVEASFDVAWLVTVSAGAGGDITESAPGAGSAGRFAPNGRGVGTTSFKVRNGRDKTFTVEPDAGYSIGPVRVDGGITILGAGSKYTFANVSADHSIEATFTANPTLTPTPVPSASPAPTTAPTAVPTATPTPVPTPDPGIPLPKVTLTITLYAGGTLVAGPIDITDPATLSALLGSPTLLAQLLATDPAAILSGQYNMDLVRFFSLIADLDDGVLDFTILFEVKVEGVPAGYRAQVFVLTRTFDSNGNPTGYSVVPRDEGASVFRKRSGARGWTEIWRVTVRDGGAADGDARQDGSVAPQIAAVVAVFPMATPSVTMTPTPGDRGGGGCSIPASGGAALAALLLLAPVVLMRRR